MPTDPRLENYLSRLDRALSAIPTSERAEIITEIKSHVLEAQGRTEGQSLDAALLSFGEPESVANRYLSERGLRPVVRVTGEKSAADSWLKWLVIGFLGLFAVTAMMIGFLVWRFTPVIQVNEKDQKVRILGGLIDIDTKKGQVSVGGESLDLESQSRIFEGTRELDRARIKAVWVPFSNGKVEVRTSEDAKLRWKCKLYVTQTGGQSVQLVREESDRVILDLARSGGLKCEISVPEKLKFVGEGVNGKVSLDRPSFPVDLNLVNGKVEIRPASGRKYRYDLRAETGKVDHFETSSDRDAIPIKILLKAGEIGRERDEE